MAFTFERASAEIIEQLPHDRGAKWLVGRLVFVVSDHEAEHLQREFMPGEPDAERIHLRLLEQYAHLRDCPVHPGHEGYSAEAQQVALKLAEDFAEATQLSADLVEANMQTVADHIYPGAQQELDDAIDSQRRRVLTE